jgi:hypothetical protein
LELNGNQAETVSALPPSVSPVSAILVAIANAVNTRRHVALLTVRQGGKRSRQVFMPKDKAGAFAEQALVPPEFSGKRFA